MALFEGDPDPTPPPGLVTVGRYPDATTAGIAKGMLEAAGVETFVYGENVNQLMPGTFRVRLQVHKEDEAEALELLDYSGGE